MSDKSDFLKYFIDTLWINDILQCLGLMYEHYDYSPVVDSYQTGKNVPNKTFSFQLVN